MAIETFMSLARGAGHEPLPIPRRSAMGTAPFDAAGRGRRGLAWNPTRLGQNTLLFSHGLELLARSRDAVRNSAYAAAAVDTYVANAIGRGIRMVSQHPDEATRDLLTAKWNRWTKECDEEYEPKNPTSGQTNFYGIQQLVARETMEAGEVFVRFIPRPVKEGLTVPLQLQLIESEQLPLWRMTRDDVSPKNSVRCGIEWRPDNRREAYHFWRAHPGETMFFPIEGLQTERVDARDILHVYKPVRAKQMRGQPWLTAVLAKLYELEQYSDAEVVRKKTSAMITGFIKQLSSDNPVLPPDPTAPPTDLATQTTRLEPGSFPVLNNGEEIQFATPPASGDFAPTMKICLRAFAAGAGILYEQLGDLEGVSYSSIRQGILEFRRKVSQIQHSVFIFQFCHPVYLRWLRDGMLSLSFGVDLLNQYDKDPEPFEAVEFVTPGFPWVDPEKDVRASVEAIRNGLSDRSTEVAATGRDSAAVDRQQAADNKRADDLNLPYDSDARKVITGKNAGMTEADIQEETDAQAADAKQKG
jgi:lambda family phage portal protein